MNPPPWWSEPWLRWVLSIIPVAAVVAWIWKKWFRYPVVVFITKWTVGKHDCGHRSGSYVIDANRRRTCVRCDQAKYSNPPPSRP